jgi:hypothetical protein
MWASTLLLVAATALPNQPAGLQIKNVRVTTGPFGATRDKEVPELQYGDIFYVYYDIENLEVDNQGQAQYTISMEVSNGKGSVIYSDGPRDGTANLTLGGGKMPAFTTTTVGKEDPGEYTVKVTIVDRGNKKTVDLTRKFKIKKPEFGIVQPSLKFYTKSGRETIDAPALCVVGQTPVATAFVGSFARDKDDNPDLEITFNVVDLATKNSITEKPAVQTIKKGIPKDQDFIQILYPVELNRTGKFKIEMVATDKISKKKDTFTFPITVEEGSK